MLISPARDRIIDSTKFRDVWNPTLVEIENAEMKLKGLADSFPFPLSKYKRQYYGYLDSATKAPLIFTRFLYFDDLPGLDTSAYRRKVMYLYDSEKRATTAIFNVREGRIESFYW